jgi:tetraacyldisaccharide 4'-kinase
VMKYADHHPFSPRDMEEIIRRFKNLPTQKKILVTTEKDVMRLKSQDLSTILENLPLFCIPMEIDFHGNDKESFDNQILTYVNKNQGNH